MHAPDVSVVMATYNHAAFVEQAMRSVLSQRDVDLELLVADDGSRDGTAAVVASVDDPRVSFTPHARNRGACAVTNELIRRASGRYIAVINSDDWWLHDDKLAAQMRLLDGHPELGASFGRVRFVDEAGETIPQGDLPYGHVFDQENRSRGRWLRYFFDVGNCLCHPSILIRRECYDRVGLYDNRLRQLPDWDMWIRLLKSYDIHVGERQTVGFRVLPGHNASSMTAINSRRGLNETYFILRDFFSGMAAEELRDGFGDRLVASGPLDGPALAAEQALLYFQDDPHLWYVRRLIGLELLRDLLDDPAGRQMLLERYGFDDLRFQDLAGEGAALDSSLPVMEERLAAETRRADKLNACFVDALRELDDLHQELARLHRTLPMRVGHAARHPGAALRSAGRRALGPDSTGKA